MTRSRSSWHKTINPNSRTFPNIDNLSSLGLKKNMIYKKKAYFSGSQRNYCNIFILFIIILSGIVLIMRKNFQSNAQLNSKVFIELYVPDAVINMLRSLVGIKRKALQTLLNVWTQCISNFH